MEMLQTVLITLTLAIWLVFSVVFLISTIQSFIFERKCEKRNLEKEIRDLEYHEARMKEITKHI